METTDAVIGCLYATALYSPCIMIEKIRSIANLQHTGELLLLNSPQMEVEQGFVGFLLIFDVDAHSVTFGMNIKRLMPRG